MPASFTDNEMIEIRARLKSHARTCLLRYGVKKTSIDQLVEEAGISKGAFYKFYDSKELLFFEIFEDIQNEISVSAVNALKENADLPAYERIRKVILASLFAFDELGGAAVWNDEIDYVMRKLPEERLKGHFHLDETQIEEIILNNGFKVSRSSREISAIIRAMFLLLSHKKEIGEDLFDSVATFFTDAISAELMRV